MMEAVAEQQQESLPPVDYVQYYHLDNDPFLDEIDFFFPGGGRQELLEHLLHHCQFGTSLLVVLGDKGAGKTRLCEVLSLHLNGPDAAALADQQLCFIDAAVLNSTGQIMAELSKTFGVPGGLSSAPAQQPSLVAEPHRVLLVDNAQCLEESALETLAYMARDQEGADEQWHIVLFGESAFAERVTEDQLQEVLLHHLYLPLLSADEVKDYLESRLVSVGMSSELSSPFDDIALGKLWAESQGNMARLNDLARSWLAESVRNPSPKRSGLPVVHLLAVTVLGAVLLLAFLYQGDDAAQAENGSTRSVPLPMATKVPAANTAAGEVVRESALSTDSGVARDAGRAALSDTASQSGLTASDRLDVNTESHIATNVESAELVPVIRSQAIAKAEEPVAEAEPLASVLEEKSPEVDSASTPADTVKSVETVTESIPEPQAVAAVNSELSAELSPSPPKPVSQTRSSAEANGLTGDEKELLSAPAGFYALQVLSAASREGVEQFVRRQSNRQSLSVYATRRQGRNWFVVVAGQYPDRNAAKAAIADLPAPQRDSGPWPRKLAEVQDEIKHFRGLL